MKRGWKCTPKSFHLLKFWATSLKNGKKWRPTFDFFSSKQKIRREKLHKSFSGKFGEIRAKILRIPNICLLLHLRLKWLKSRIFEVGKHRRHDYIERVTVHKLECKISWSWPWDEKIPQKHHYRFMGFTIFTVHRSSSYRDNIWWK